ncbi:MAG: hypothetical protein MI807_00390 [Verrucomicrobiales bacterium]|nr:hypothetical protein [Verrucomicrobiales bacterium]
MKLIFSLFGIVCLCEIGYAGTIRVTDTKGRSMDVEVISHIPNTGMTKIKRTDGQVFNVNINLFDAESQKSIVANAPEPQAELEVSVSVGKRRKRQGDSSYMKDQTITATVTVENDSRDIDFTDGNGTLFLIARQTRRYAEDGADYGKVLSKQVFRITTKADEETKYEAKPVVTSYDSDRDSTNVGGWEYYGYLFILEDSNKEIKEVVTSIGNLKKDVEGDSALAKKLLNLSQESIVEKNLEKR